MMLSANTHDAVRMLGRRYEDSASAATAATGAQEESTSVRSLLRLTIRTLPASNEANVVRPWDACRSAGQFRGAYGLGATCPTSLVGAEASWRAFLPNVHWQ